MVELFQITFSDSYQYICLHVNSHNKIIIILVKNFNLNKTSKKYSLNTKTLRWKKHKAKIHKSKKGSKHVVHQHQGYFLR